MQKNALFALALAACLALSGCAAPSSDAGAASRTVSAPAQSSVQNSVQSTQSADTAPAGPLRLLQGFGVFRWAASGRTVFTSSPPGPGPTAASTSGTRTTPAARSCPCAPRRAAPTIPTAAPATFPCPPAVRCRRWWAKRWCSFSRASPAAGRMPRPCPGWR